MKLKLFLLLVFAAAAWAQTKTDFDLSGRELGKTQSVKSAQAINPVEFKNGTVHLTLVQGGYFTLGTTGGASTDAFDDNCQLTFGHPYALTSYPVFSIDGKNWYKTDEYFTEMSTVKSGDTLKFTGINKGVVSVTLLIYYETSDNSIKIIQKIKNLDVIAHTAACGLIYDPAMGMNGDAVIEQNGTFITESKTFGQSDMPSEILLREKKDGSKGLTAGLSFVQTPEQILAQNWNEVYMNQGPTRVRNPKLYDLLLKIYWPEGQLNAGSEDVKTAKLALKQPDIQGSALLRWDLPLSVTVDNNIMFPQDLKSYVQIVQNKVTSISNPKLSVEISQELTTPWADKSYTSVPSFAEVDFSVKTQYDNSTAEAAVKLYDGTKLIDEIRRNIFIPYTPVSDSGLTVKADTLITSKFPKVSITFNATSNKTGAKLTNLTQENILLYENSHRITNFSLMKDTTGGNDATDIVFALDVTGSMGGTITAVKNNIIEFADSLEARGVDFQLGLVTFLDAIENIYPFTRDAQAFQAIIGQQQAHGGGDANENSLQALMECQRFPFRPSAKRIVIWITDIGYHENDSYTKLTKKDVIDSLLVKGILVHAIGSSASKQEYYDPIITPTGGNFYNIYGNFRDILLDISRLKSIYKYILSYNSTEVQKGTNEITLKVRYAGFGGSLTLKYGNMPAGSEGRLLSFYPNPFNPEITFRVNKGNYVKGIIRIYDVLGRLVHEFPLKDGSSQNIIWNARNMTGENVSAGFYVTELVLTGADKSTHIETAKIMYLK